MKLLSSITNSRVPVSCTAVLVPANVLGSSRCKIGVLELQHFLNVDDWFKSSVLRLVGEGGFEVDTYEETVWRCCEGTNLLSWCFHASHSR